MHVHALSLLTPRSTAAGPLWEHQLGLLLESTGEGIFGVDLDGHCMFINRAGASMLGFEPAEVLGANMHELTHHSHAGAPHRTPQICRFRFADSNLPIQICRFTRTLAHPSHGRRAA